MGVAGRSESELVLLVESLTILVGELQGQVKSLQVVESGLRAQLAAAHEQNRVLADRVAQLEAGRRTTSRNSSKPPSSDQPGSRTRSLRRASGRKPGGQVGHEGATLQMRADPHEVVTHRPTCCSRCGLEFASDAGFVGVSARQVFDLPEGIDLRVVEHRVTSLACPCGTVTQALAPPKVTAQVQYGPRITAVACYLADQHHVPVARAAHILTDLCGAPISTGTIETMRTRVATTLTDRFAAAAKNALAQADVLHVDETGFKIGGKLTWMHSASTPTLTWIAPHPKRGRAAMDDIGILATFTGVLVHDAWAPYDTLPTVTGHQLCAAHLLRELQAVTDHHAHPEGQWCWADQAATALTAIIHNPATVDRNQPLITAAIATADRFDPDLPGKLGRKHAALRKRLHTRLNDYLRFTTDPTIPPTNNPAEQEIRMIKIKQKISGGLRTLDGATRFTTIRSYLATTRKHGLNPLTALTSAATGTPWLPTTP